jgi:hypothetical protein
VQPHRQTIGELDIENAVKHKVRRIEGSHVAFGDERKAESEPAAPIRKPALFERAGKLALQGAIESVGIAAYRLVADEQAAQYSPHRRDGQNERQMAASGTRVHIRRFELVARAIMRHENGSGSLIEKVTPVSWYN